MTPLAAGTESSGFSLLDELLQAEDLWIDRAEEARALAADLTVTSSKIVVLLGPARAGKTELARRWLIPILARTSTVAYRDSCDVDATPQDVPDGSILFWDSFEVCLTDEGLARGALAEELSRFASQGGRSKVVLMVREESVSRLFQLSAKVPELLKDLREVPALSGDRIIQTIQRACDRHGIAITGGFLEALGDDLNRLPAAAALGSELVAILTFEISRMGGRTSELAKEDYVAAGGLEGLVEGHLDFLFERSPAIADPQVAWAVLQEAANSGAGQPLNLTEVAHRFEIQESVPMEVVRWLEEDRRLLRRRADAAYALVPPQLGLALESRRGREALVTEQVRGVLRQGLRQFVESEALPSPHGFKRVHASRTALKVTEEEAQLMVRCALAYAGLESTGAIDYWLGRLCAESSKIDVLFDATFDPAADVRARAAQRLRSFARPEIRNQLHLLALRDPSADVRAAAVGALDAVKDDDLHRSLLKEIAEQSSPYRLQAIEALRIFSSSETTAALVSLVRTNAVRRDLDARPKAIEVLGLQNTAESAEALLSIAIDDEDVEDREAAIAALRSMPGPGSVDSALARLHQLRLDARRVRLVFSWKSLALRLIYTALAVGALALNVVFHGLLLLLIRRRRLATAVLIGEGVGLALVYPHSSPIGDSSPIGGFTLLFTFFLGVLMALRTLLLERLDLKPQTHFRRCLSGVLFGFCCMSAFLYLHGLASLLTRRIRQGMGLFGFELLGILFVVIAVFLVNLFAAYTDLTPAVAWFGSLSAIGLALLLVSYFMGVGTVLLDAFFLRTRRFHLRRIDAISAQLLRNPIAADAVLRSLTDASPAAARWGLQMVKRFGKQLERPLQRWWEQSDPRTQRMFFRYVAWHADADAVEFLRKAAPALGWRARVRAFWADLAYRLSVWPTPVLVGLALILYANLAIVAGYLPTRPVHPGSIAADIQNADKRIEDRQKAVNNLEKLSTQSRDPEVAEMAASKLVAVLDSANDDLLPPELQKRILQAAVSVAPASRKQRELVGAVARLLKKVETQKDAVDALHEIGTSDAVAKLREFVEDPVPASRPKEDPAQAAENETGAKNAAIAALGTMKGAGTEPLRALLALASNMRVPEEFRKAASAAADRFDPLIRAEYYFREEDFAKAISEANAALKTSSMNQPQQHRADVVIGRSYAALGSIAIEQRDYDTAKERLAEALKALPRDESAPEIIGLGLNVAFAFHEFRAPHDSTAYADVFQILSEIEPLATDAETRDTVQANLLESSLTTGRYDDALAIAQQLSKRPSLDPSTNLGIKYLLFASLMMGGATANVRTAPDKSTALNDLNRYYDSLPAGFSNRWSYAGTRKYIETAPVADEVKSLLLKTLAHIETPKPK